MKRSRTKGAQRRPTGVIRKMEVGCRLIFNVQHEQQEPSRSDVAFFAELLNRLRTIGVVWDMNIMSHGGRNRRGTYQDRTVEIALYREEGMKGVTDHSIEAALTIVTLLKSVSIPYRVLKDAEIMPRRSE
jgi:hypothetical protein